MNSLLILDMTRTYIYGDRPLIPVAHRPQLIANIQKAIGWAHEQPIPVIYINTAFHENDPILDVIGHRPQAMHGAEGTRVITDLTPQKEDYILEKRGYDGFWKSGLEELLKKLNITGIYLAGQQTDCCVRETGVTAAHLGYRVHIIEDCVDTSRELGQESSLIFMRRCVGEIVKLGEVTND